MLCLLFFSLSFFFERVQQVMETSKIELDSQILIILPSHLSYMILKHHLVNDSSLKAFQVLQFLDSIIL